MSLSFVHFVYHLSRFKVEWLSLSILIGNFVRYVHFVSLVQHIKLKTQFSLGLAVPSAPADIKAVTSASSSVIVSWRAPSQPNGVIQKYTVYRREIISGKEVIIRIMFLNFAPKLDDLLCLLFF